MNVNIGWTLVWGVAGCVHKVWIRVCPCVVVHGLVFPLEISQSPRAVRHNRGGKQRGVYWAYAAYDPQRGTGSLF